MHYYKQPYLMRTSEGPGSRVVPEVSLQVVPLGEGLATVLYVANVTVGLRVLLK